MPRRRPLTRSSLEPDATAADSLAVAPGRQQAPAVAVVCLVAAAAGLFLTVWRPRARTSAAQAPAVRVPYSHVRFTVTDAERAFAAVGVRLVPKSRIPGIETTIGTSDDAFEVDVFGDPARVNAVGSPDVITDSRGAYVRIPRTCTPGTADAGRWRANGRVVVRCAGATDARLPAIGAEALAKL